MSKIQVYCAVSLDGFISGENDDLSWLVDPAASNSDPGTIDFATFLSQTGAMLMGRRTYDVVMGFGEWPYGQTPVFVATTRPLQNAPATVTVVQGDIKDLCEKARAFADGKNVYLDGGSLVTQALDAGCVDEMILTVVPVLVGKGSRLYSGSTLHRFSSNVAGRMGSMTQLHLTRASRNFVESFTG